MRLPSFSSSLDSVFASSILLERQETDTSSLTSHTHKQHHYPQSTMASPTAEIYDLSTYTRAYDPKESSTFATPTTASKPLASAPSSGTSNARSPSSAKHASAPQQGATHRQPLSPPCSEKSSHSSATSISSEVAEQIFDLIENIVERKMTEALRPYLLNTQALAGERAGLHQQNDTFSRQIELHYNSIQRQNDLLDCQAQTFAAVTGAQANAVEATNQGLVTVTNLVNHMSQTVTSLAPSSVHETVSTVVQKEVRDALREVLQVQKGESMSVCSTLNEPSRESVEKKDGHAKKCPCILRRTHRENFLRRAMKKVFGKA